MIGPLTPAQMMRKLLDFDERKLNRATQTGIAAGARKALARSTQEILQGGVARGVWGGKGKALSFGAYMKTFNPGKSTRGMKRPKGKFFAPGVAPLIVGVNKVRRIGRGTNRLYRGGIYVAGMAAHIEIGKPTKPHNIGNIRHPGSRVPRNPFLPKRAARAPGYMAPAINKAIARAILKAGLN